jgi:hypothetical protein
MQPHLLEDDVLAAASLAAFQTLIARDFALFEGMAEWMEEEEVRDLARAAWDVFLAGIEGKASEDGHEDLEDHEIQEYAAAALHALHARGGRERMATALAGLDLFEAESAAVVLEDWLSRYEPEEAGLEDCV